MADNPLTEQVVASAAQCADPRLRRIFTSLVRHLHAFTRDVELTPEEWAIGIAFLTATGHKCDDLRQEFMMLSDTLGLTSLVDTLAHGHGGEGTESSVLGPFYTEDAPEVEFGGSIASEGKGEPLQVAGFIRDPRGAPIAGAIIDVWETDGNALYDNQYEQRDHPECRGRLRSSAAGEFRFRAVLPVGYSIPTDGPVGQMLLALGRHTFRPAHLHFRIAAEGFEPLVTALYVAGAPHLDSDAVFGVKPSLIAQFRKPDGSYALERDFVLVPVRVAQGVR